MNSILVFQSLFSGIMMGSIYALLGVGFSLSWGVMKVINISHAAFGLLAAFLAYSLLQWLGIDPIVSVVITTPFLFLIACFIYRFLIDLSYLSPVIIYKSPFLSSSTP